jgi:hypothetical protein
MCAGRGVCNYENVVNGTIQPKCECFDPSDTSPGCSDSLLPTGDFLDDATGLFDNVQEDFFDPLIAVFVDHPDKWTSSSWAWAAGLLTVFFVMLLCICSTFWPESTKEKREKYRGSGSPDKKSKSTPSRSSSKKRSPTQLKSIPSPRDSYNPKESSKDAARRSSSRDESSSSRRARTSSTSRKQASSAAAKYFQQGTISHNSSGIEHEYTRNSVSPRNYQATSSSYAAHVRSPSRHSSKGYDYDRPVSPNAAEL